MKLKICVLVLLALFTNLTAKDYECRPIDKISLGIHLDITHQYIKDKFFSYEYNHDTYIQDVGKFRVYTNKRMGYEVSKSVEPVVEHQGLKGYAVVMKNDKVMVQMVCMDYKLLQKMRGE